MLFDELININASEYLQETKKIKSIIDEENIIIRQYNILINEIIGEINRLKKWNDFVEFENDKYGNNNKIINNIHRENDCNGNMLLINSTFNQCYQCEWGMWPCSGGCSSKENTYKCDKCGFIYLESLKL